VGQFVLDGTPRMRERPIKDLVDGLKQLEVDVTCSDTGCPPVRIRATGLPGGLMRISGKISSQVTSTATGDRRQATGQALLSCAEAHHQS
jgi:3-phosphoshikimate 1-carboxyvinyltransferase